jgi:hypothetical protein
MRYTMRNTIEQRAYDAFDDDDAEKAQKYLDTVMASWKDVSAAIGRVVLFTLLLAAAFEFLTIPAAVKSLSIGPLSFSNTSLVQEFIPALIAYLLFYELSLSHNWADHQDLYEAILKRFQPKLARSNLTLTVQPRILGPWTSLGPSDAFNIPFLTRSEKFDLYTSTFTTVIVYLILPLAFEAQAYYELVRKYGAHDVLVIVSAILSGLFIALWVTYIVIGLIEVVSKAKSRFGPEIVANLVKLYSGDLAAVADIISDLEDRKRERGLLHWEKYLLNDARKRRQELSGE